MMRIRAVPPGAGFEAWRVLNARYGKTTATSALGMLQAVLDFDLSGYVEEKLFNLRGLADDYEKKVGEAVSDVMLRAVVAKNVPEPLKQHVNLNAGRFTTFNELQGFIVDFARCQRPWRQAAVASTAIAGTTGATAMEVDYLPKGKSKGKGKDGKKGENFYPKGAGKKGER